jgi:phosphopantothenoylcysteine decarboxylase/phosphopantothenate--cysteine ligase
VQNESFSCRLVGSASFDYAASQVMFQGRTIALAVTGSVAAYKAVEIARACIAQRATVLPLMTKAATQFLGPVTLSGITGQPVRTSMWDAAYPGEMHVELATKADVLVIAPATADVLARLAAGRADDLVTATALCARGPVIVAPAMHPRMWSHPATVRNVAELTRQGRTTFVGPVDGPVASGESGMGRMAEPAAIVAAIQAALQAQTQDLAGYTLLVTAGPTHEPIDPVRYVANRSSGKMGFFLAARAAARGARVVLVTGPVALPTPPSVRRVNVETALEMQAAIDAELGSTLGGADAVIMAAAVADFRPEHAAETKIKKTADERLHVLSLQKNPDLLAALGARRVGDKPKLVGFALETGQDDAVVAYAKAKLVSKRVDIIVANSAHESLGHDTNRVALVRKDSVDPFVAGSKGIIADCILDALAGVLRERA